MSTAVAADVGQPLMGTGASSRWSLLLAVAASGARPAVQHEHRDLEVARWIVGGHNRPDAASERTLDDVDQRLAHHVMKPAPTCDDQVLMPSIGKRPLPRVNPSSRTQMTRSRRLSCVSCPAPAQRTVCAETRSHQQPPGRRREEVTQRRRSSNSPAAETESARRAPGAGHGPRHMWPL